MSLLLALLYPLAIQYKRGWYWYWVIPFFTVPAFIIDVIANYTELALITWDRPRPYEYTFSKRLKRLRYYNDFRGTIARIVIPYLDFFDPTGNHLDE